MALKDDAVFRHLPPLLRKAGPDTPAYPVGRMLARALGDLDRISRDVLKAHFLDDATDLADVERLAALYGLAPWDDEDLAAFRDRVKLLITVYLQGAATASSLLTVTAAAAGARIAAAGDGAPALLLPGHSGSWPELSAALYTADRFTTFALLQGAGPVFGAAVVDLPPVERHLDVPAAPDGRLEWTVANDLFALPGEWTPDGVTPDTWPDPVCEIAAGAAPVYLPVIVQRDLRRLVLVNRWLPPGARIAVDPVQGTVTDLSGPASVKTALAVAGAPDLLYATGALLGESGLSGHLATPPAHVLRWYGRAQVAFGTDQPLTPDLPGLLTPAPATLPWPSLLGEGDSRWRVLVCEDAYGDPVDAARTLPLAQVRPVPPTPATGPAAVTIRWRGRQAGTFTLLVDPAHLAADGPGGPSAARRRAWLTEQVLRLKLAGVRYIPFEATTLNLGALSGSLPA